MPSQDLGLSNEPDTSPAQKRSTSNRLSIGIFLVLCLGFVGMGILLLIHSAAFGIPAQGTIIDARATDCPKATTGVDYAVQFTDQNGQSHISPLLLCGGQADLALGESVTILYHQDDPTVIGLAGHLDFNFISGLLLIIFFGLIALLVLGFWIAQLRGASRPAQKRPEE
jgi:hypothetical protein